MVENGWIKTKPAIKIEGLDCVLLDVRNPLFCLIIFVRKAKSSMRWQGNIFFDFLSLFGSFVFRELLPPHSADD